MSTAFRKATDGDLPAVLALYRPLGFDFVGECHKYGIDFFACEKLL